MSRKTGDSGGRAVALGGETVYSVSATRTLDGHPGAQADVMETRAKEWGSRRWNREFSGGTRSSSDETRGSGNGSGCSVVENRDPGKETENSGSVIGG